MEVPSYGMVWRALHGMKEDWVFDLLISLIKERGEAFDEINSYLAPSDRKECSWDQNRSHHALWSLAFGSRFRRIVSHPIPRNLSSNWCSESLPCQGCISRGVDRWVLKGKIRWHATKRKGDEEEWIDECLRFSTFDLRSVIKVLKCRKTSIPGVIVKEVYSVKLLLLVHQWNHTYLSTILLQNTKDGK